MVAKTLSGLEGVLADELLKLGAKDIEQQNRAVSFAGDKGFMYKANYSLRTALRVIKPIQTFEVENEQELYENIRKINWDEYLDVKGTLSVDTSLNSELFTHSQYISQKTKDAVVDQYRDKYGVLPSVDLEKPTLKINIHIYKNTCTVSLDSSGESLHKRGYRDKVNLAPLNEVLGAGLVLLSEWDKRSNFVDPMCGSGTILIEAAMLAANIPPGYYREDFGFQTWKDYEEELFDTIAESAIGKINDEKPKILGSDISRNVARKAYTNVQTAKLDDAIEIKTSALYDFTPPEGKGTLIINPPYGERMNKEDISALYKSIGDTFKKKYAGYNCWLITSNLEAAKNIGLRPSRRIAVYNGPLECKFLKYQMYEGTKKIHKIQSRQEKGEDDKKEE